MSRFQISHSIRRTVALPITGLAATCSVLIGGAAFADTTPAFTVRSIGNLPGGTKSWGMDVTPGGDVVGYASTVGHTTPHAFYWDALTGTMTDIGTLSGNPGSESFGYAIASTGYACGASEYLPPPNANRDAFIWWSTVPGMLPIGPPPPGHLIGAAHDIEFDPMWGLHRVVGYTIDVTTNAPHATLWNFETATSTSLGTLTGNPADWSRAFGVNEFGDIVGMSNRGALPSHAFIYQNNQMIDIDKRMTGACSCGYGVNNAGQIVGFWEPQGVATDSACRWQHFAPAGWQMTDLGCLPGSSLKDACAMRINNAGLVVGWSFDPGDGNRKACIWLNDQIHDLNSLIIGYNPLKELMSAQGVNINGQIVGYGLDRQGLEQAFILDPATLILNTPVPGEAGIMNDFYANGATPGQKVHFVYALQPGTTSVPGCPGLVVELKKPKIIAAKTADAFGTAQLSVNIPSNAAGTKVLFQAVEIFSCRVSNRVDFTFH